MIITPGPPEVYKFKNGSIATLISNGPSGQENAILSINHDYPCTYFEISIWLNRFGMTCVGGGSFEAVEKPHPSLRKALGVVWHSMGSALCVIAHGDVSFIKISWMNKSTMTPVVFSEATSIYDIGAASTPLPNIGDQIAVKLLRKKTHSVEATAICQGDNGRYLLVSSSRRVIYKFTWLGVKISETSTDIHHEVFRSWELGSLFSFTKAQCQVYSSKSNEISPTNLTAPSLDRREESNRPRPKVTDACLLAEDCSVSESERIISCGYCSALQIHYFIRGDGSLLFLQDLDSTCEQSVKARTVPTSGFRCTGLIHMFTLTKPDLAGVDQKSHNRSSNGVNGSYRIDESNLINGGRQPAVCRVTHVCVIQGEDGAESSSIPGAEFCGDSSALFVMTVLTCHLPSNGSISDCDRYNGHSQHLSSSSRSRSSSIAGNSNGNSKVEQRATLSLIAVRVRIAVHCHGESEQSDVLKMDQVSSVILEVSSGSVYTSQSNPANDAASTTGCTVSERSHSLATLRRFGQVSQLVLVTVRGVISCRPVESLSAELFRIDTNSYSNGVRHAISSMTSSLGRLHVAVTRVSDSQDAVCTESWSQVFVIPLLESAESSVFHRPCGDVLVDGAEQRLLAFKMLWNQDPGSIGPEGPGYFNEVSLPDGLILEWRARVRYLSIQSARGKNVSGGVLLVASSAIESSGVRTGRIEGSFSSSSSSSSSASASAGKGYLAVVVAGRSALRGDPCLWVYNTLTRRWRSCDITKGKVEGEGEKMPFSSIPTERSSMERGSGLWVDVEVKQGSGAFLSKDVLLHRQYSTDSEMSNSSKIEYKRATSISQYPSPSGNSSSSSSPAPNLAVRQATSSILGISWFGDHSLIMLRRTDSAPSSAGSPRAESSLFQPCFTLEVLSRAPTKESMRSGRPRPAVHRVVPLSLAVPPTLSLDTSQCDFSPRLFEVRHCVSERREGLSDLVTERCTVVLSNGWYCIGYSVEILNSNSTDLDAAVDYRVSLISDISLSDRGLGGSGSPLKSLSLVDRNGQRESVNASMALPISAVSILSSTAGEGFSLMVLDALGAAWRVRPLGFDLMGRGPFAAMTSVHFDSLFRSDCGKDGAEGTMDLLCRATPRAFESAVILHGAPLSNLETNSSSSSGNSNNNAITGDYIWMSLSPDDETTVSEGDSPFLLMPLERTHTDSALGSRPTPLSMTVGVVKGCLITLHRALECLPLSSASSSSSSGMRDLLLAEASGLTVSKVSLGFNLFLGLIEILSGRKSCGGMPMTNSSMVPLSDRHHSALVSVMRRFLGTIQSPMHSPITLRLFVECLELHIKHLLERSTFFTPQKYNRWVRVNAPVNLPDTPSPFIRTDTFVTGRERYCEIMSALYYCSPPSSSVFCELISRLGRKLEPSLSRRLFPVPLDPRLFSIPIHTLHVPLPLPRRELSSFTSPSIEALLPSQGTDAAMTEMQFRSLPSPLALPLAQHPSPAPPLSPSPGPSPLSVFEHALSTRQLNRSCRLLTLACEDVGGTDSPASASLCMRMVLELLYECLRHLSMPLAVQCFDFCRRLEVMIASMDIENSDRQLGSGTNLVSSTSPATGQSRQGVRVGEPQAAPAAHSRGQRRSDISPELQVACGGNSVWLGVGGGVYSTLTSVSPALSYYIGGTMIWAVAQTIRLLSDAPPAPSSSSSSSSVSDSSLPRGNPDVRSTYAYTVLPALTVPTGPASRTGCASPSPSMALLILVLKDVLSKGKYHCCAVLMTSLLAASSSAVFKDLLRARLLQLYLSLRTECRGMLRTEEESSIEGAKTATAVATAFKLNRLISLKGRERDRARDCDSLSAKLSQALLPPYMRVKCEREMVAIEQPFSTLNKEGSDSCTTLIASDVILSVLSDAQALRSSSRAVFHSAAEITAQAIREQTSLSLPLSQSLEDTDTDTSQQRVRSVSVLLTTLTAAPSLAPSPTLKGQAQPAVRVLPDAGRAVCNIDTGGLMIGHSQDMTAPRKNPADENGASTGANTSAGAGAGAGAASSPTIRIMLCSVCIAMLLTGDAEGAGAVASLLLDRPDIKAFCSVLSHSHSHSDSCITPAVPVPVPSSPSSGGVTDGDQLEHESEVEQRRDLVAAAVSGALSFFLGHSA